MRSGRVKKDNEKKYEETDERGPSRDRGDIPAKTHSSEKRQLEVQKPLSIHVIAIY